MSQFEHLVNGILVWEAKLRQNQNIHKSKAVPHNIRDRNLPCAAAAYKLVVNSMFTLTGCFGERGVHRTFEFGELHVQLTIDFR